MRNILSLVYQQGTKIWFKSKSGIYLVCKFFCIILQFFRVNIFVFPEIKLYVAVKAFVCASKVDSCVAEMYVDMFQISEH